jgi:short-subunit dehydrogenase
MYSILITGGSSGIGKALAQAYAHPQVRLLLVGRNAERLRTVAPQCEVKGAIVELGILDVRDQDQLKKWLLDCDEATPIDLVIANAGISMGNQPETPEGISELFAVNVQGLFNTILPLIPRMKARRQGQIALMSSLAAFRGYASRGAYAATKAAVKAYGEALRLELKSHGIRVSTIYPGFVATPLTAQNKFEMPCVMSADKAAQIIVKGLQGNKARIAFPLPMFLMAYGMSILPPFMADWLSERMLSKLIKQND